MASGKGTQRRRRGLRAGLAPAAVTFAVSAFLLLVADQKTTSWIPTRHPEATASVVATAADKSPAGEGTVGALGDEEAIPAKEPSESEGKQAAPTCSDLLVLVDRSHSLPADYVPGDLVPLASYGVPVLGGGDMRLRREAAEALAVMSSAARADGEELAVASAFRSFADQETSHARLKEVYGEGAMSAPPGHSQHQLGTAVDLTNATAGYEVSQYFGQTSAYAWLTEHAAEYGFVLAYPFGGEEETGYGWEPWHFLYVGVENAGHIAQSGTSVQGYLSAEGVAPRC